MSFSNASGVGGAKVGGAVRALLVAVGTLTAAAAVATPVKGDFNGDGQPDLVLVNHDGSNCSLHQVWLMSEAQRVGSVNVVNVCGSTSKLSAVDDFNADGHEDLVFVHTPSGQAIVYFTNGTGLTGVQNVSGLAPLGAQWELASSGDFNGDGTADLVWRDTVTQKLRIWTMTGTQATGTLVPTPDQAVDANWRVVGTLDFDGDGARDFLWYNPNSGKIVFWFMDANLQRIAGRFANPPNAGNNNWKVVAAGDYGVGSGGPAGTADIVWQNETSGNIVVWYMDHAGNRTSGTFTTPAAPSPALQWSVSGPR